MPKTNANDLRTLNDLLAAKKILVLCGTGGVGKTSVSASLAILAARQGKRVLVLTIDPSKRLAQTLGINLAKEEIKEIPPSRWQNGTSARSGGHLYGMVLNPKKTFDEIVTRFSKTPESARDILQNPVYQHLSSILAGSQEYMAMEKLLHLSEKSSDYDLIILDTPPSQHALDFLDAPQKMVRAISDSVLKYFLKPGLFIGRSGFKLLRRGPKIFFSLLDKVAGLRFLEEISELLILAQGLLEGFAERAQEVEKLLQSDKTGFCVVSTLSPWSAREAVAFFNSLGHKHVDLCGIFLNRTIPDFEWSLSSADAKSLPKETITAAKTAFDTYHALHLRESQEESRLRSQVDVPFWKLPLLEQEVHDLETLKVMAGILGKNLLRVSPIFTNDVR